MTLTQKPGAGIKNKERENTMIKEQNKGRKTKEKGFTLIEVMVAIVIFSFALLGLAALQLGAIKANSTAMGTTEALNVAQTKMEELIGLQYTDAQLVDTNGDGGSGLGIPTRVQVLSNTIPATGGAGGPDFNQTLNNGTRDYNVYWNIDESTLSNGKRIRVIVAWLAKGMHRLDLSYIKHQ